MAAKGRAGKQGRLLGAYPALDTISPVVEATYLRGVAPRCGKHRSPSNRSSKPGTVLPKRMGVTEEPPRIAAPGNGTHTVVIHSPLAILSNLNRIILPATLNTIKINTLNSRSATERDFPIR